MIHIIVLNVHRNPLYWGDNAELFVPERFEPERFNKVHPYAYLPFTSKFNEIKLINLFKYIFFSQMGLEFV